MPRSISRYHKKLLKVFSICLAIVILFPTLVFAIFNFYYSGKIFPGIYVASIDLSDLSPSEAASLLSSKLATPESIKLSGDGQTFTLDTKSIGLSYDFSKTSLEAYNLVRTGNIFRDWLRRAELLIKPVNIGLSANFDSDKVQKFVSVVSGQISVPPVAPSITIKRPSVSINKGSSGTEINQDLLLKEISDNLASAKTREIQIPIEKIDQTLTDEEAEALKNRAENILGKNISLNFEFDTYNIADSEILSFLGPWGGYDDKKIDTTLNKITTQINREPQNPKFTFEGGKVTEFQPALDGVKVNQNQLKMSLFDAIAQLETTSDKSAKIDVPADRTPAEITTDKVNNMGIKELIGRGTSTYFHSIPSRVHNVVLAAGKINGTLVKPGDTFSFNDTLGDVSQFTGYQQAYIIQNGKTVLGDGGGVCQVSSTLFRAILNAGLPITERQAHAYRVGYYEQNSPPGYDATVYSPSPDLKFKNDTPGYILIEAKADPKHYSLIFELYGTSDGRVATTTRPVVTNVTAPPEDLYQDDPTLPAGTIKQIDFKAWGAKVTFNYKVVRNGETLINKTFISNYRPWQAVYLRGTAPAI